MNQRIPAKYPKDCSNQIDKKLEMMKLNVKKLGFATGLTAAFLYLGCIVVMFTVGQEGSVKFFNSLLHGLDVSTIVRMDMPIWEAGLGFVKTFVLGWLIGACIASLYNWQIKKNKML